MVPSEKEEPEGAQLRFGGRAKAINRKAALQRAARDEHWKLVKQAKASEDHKEFSKNPEWRKELMTVHSRLLHLCDGAHNKMEQITDIIRSAHAGRAQPDISPTQVAVALQPGVEAGTITQEQADTMVTIATRGVTVEEFRELDAGALDLSAGNTEDPEDEQILLDFYMAQAAMSRVLVFPEEDAAVLDSQGSLVLSPSFLVRAIGKNPRPICNLSSNSNHGVNQMMEDFEADPEGYTTISGVAKMVIDWYVDMVKNPKKYGIHDPSKIDLAMLIADAADAFTRVSVSSKAVGIQCLRIAGITIVPMCCLFGWRRSAEVFSHITASITNAYKSELGAATFLKRSEAINLVEGFSNLVSDECPAHSPKMIQSHVDDFCIVAEVSKENHVGAVADLIWAIKSHLGTASVSVKKFKQSSFWADFQKMIGAWFNVKTFTVTMPHNKIQEVIEILESPAFCDAATNFEIDLCASLRGKLRWALLATKLGDSPALINIEKQRTPGGSKKRTVKPLRHSHETQALATRKFLNDMKVYKLLMYACRDNPAVASCSMVSVLPMEHRLAVPGQSKWLVWLSGDFSMMGQSFGIEIWDPDQGHQKYYSFVEHSAATIEALRQSYAGKSKKGLGIMSSVTERCNKLMAEFMWRDKLMGRPCICLEDNQGSVATINSGYSSHVILQAMQLASNLRQAIDEAPMTSYYTNTENMSWMDRVSRLDHEFARRMNEDLAALGLPVWQYVPPCERTATALNEWLPRALKSDMPMMDELIQNLGGIRAKSHMPEVMLKVEDILAEPDQPWQNRVRAAAKPIPHYMGSFGPMAYSTQHLVDASRDGHVPEWTWEELRNKNDTSATAGTYTLHDNFHGGCGGSVAAIKAGLFVQAGADVAEEEVAQFESLTGRVSLGDVDTLAVGRMPAVHIWLSCSSCKDFAALGCKDGMKGKRGGNHFARQFEPAAGMKGKPKVVVIENVDGVATINRGEALKTLKRNAKTAGYSKLYHTKVTFAKFGDPENRSRRVIVAFHDSVDLATTWSWPEEQAKEWSTEHHYRRCAGEVLQPSTLVPSRFWNDRISFATDKHWDRKDHLKIFKLAYKSNTSKIGNPTQPSLVWHPLGLFPTCLASGNSGLVRTIFLRAMCTVYTSFTKWFDAAFSKQARERRSSAGLRVGIEPTRVQQKGRIRDRRPMPSELLESKGFPADTPVSSDEVGFRFAGNAVPVNWFEMLFRHIISYLDAAQVSRVIEPNEKQYSTWLDGPLHSHDQIARPRGFGCNGSSRVKRGHNIVHRTTRKKLIGVPVSIGELELMSSQGRYFKDGRYEEESMQQINMAWEHWHSFCLRFNRPLYLRTDTKAEVTAAFQQAKLFLHYETALFTIKAASVAQKIWGVGAKHKAKYLEDPFSNNQLLRDAIANAIAKDEPKKPKLPVTNTTLRAIRQRLDLSERKSFVLWTAIRFAITWLCRVSEYAIDGKHAVRWKHLNFYTSKHSHIGRQPITIRTLEDVYRVGELQVVFYSDKTNSKGSKSNGQGKARSWHAIRDLSNAKCIVRDMARLWLVSERDYSYKVFSWAADMQGVTRTLIDDVLKAGAVETGIPGADVSTHSLRRTGLSRLMSRCPNIPHAEPMSWPEARVFGRWESDCAFQYFWPSNELALGMAEAIWENHVIVQEVRGMRGGGGSEVA